MREWLDVEYRVAPVSGLVRVGARGVPGSPPLADVVFDSVREALRRSPGLVAVRPAGVGAVWDCIEPEAAWQPAVLEVAPGRLTLNPHQVRDLPTEHTDVGPGDVMYAEPLWAIAKDRRGRDWLEAAVRAGMVPHQEGIELAQQGLFLVTRSQVQDYIDQGELGEANGSLMFADAYRRFATLLLEEAAALERWRDELFDGGAS